MADTVRTGSPVREQVALAGYTTLRLGGPARRLVEAATEAEIVAEVQAADGRGDESQVVAPPVEPLAEYAPRQAQQLAPDGESRAAAPRELHGNLYA